MNNLQVASETVGRRVAQFRRMLDWSVEQLAERCAQVGAPQLTVNALYTIESGRKEKATGRRRRHVTVDEMLVLACALDVTPLDLLVPSTVADDAVVNLAPEVTTTARTAREWIGGGFLKHPKSPAEVFESVRFMPKERAEALMGKWFIYRRNRSVIQPIVSTPQAYLMATTGLPASGKTTWANEYMMDQPLGSVVRISRDDIRRNMFQPGYRMPQRNIEEIVTAIQHAAIEACLSIGVDVISDDTNIETEHIIALSNIASRCDAGFELVDFTYVHVETCIARDKARDPDRQVGESVLRSMSDRLHTRLASDTDA